MNIIEIKDLNRYFGEGENRVHILKNVSLNIEKGDFVAIIGQSGSGKIDLDEYHRMLGYGNQWFLQNQWERNH